MQDVPKIVTDRLRAAVPLVNHPDADVLTAFSEQSLLDRERAVVLEHLAHCGDCREIVALALPTIEAAQATFHPIPSRRIGWPALRWAFIAVGVFAIASLGVVQYRRESARSAPMANMVRPQAIAEKAKNEAPAAPVAPPVASDRDKSVLPAAAAPGNSDATAATTPLNGRQFDRLEQLTKLQPAEGVARPAVASSAGAAAGQAQFPHGPKVPPQSGFNYQTNSNSVQNNYQSQAAPLPLAKQTPKAFMDADATSQASAPALDLQDQSAQSDTEARNTQPQLSGTAMPLQPTQGGQGHGIERAKDLATVLGGPAKVPVAAPQPAAVFTGALGAPNTSWTITAGSLQRSVDQGKTWQDVDINAPPAAAANYAFAARAASASVDKKVKESAAKPEELPVFRAVTAIGADVWAGGSSGMLYHSVDSGAHWTRVVPSSDGAALTGDIVHLDFSDAQHGTITTSTPEVWLTPDDGLTWSKQPASGN